MSEPGRIERWVQVLSEQLGCTCRPSGEVARLIQEAVDAMRALGRTRETHLTRFEDIWREKMQGAKPHFARLGKAVKKVTSESEDEERTWASYVGYMRDTPEQYVSVERWAETWSLYPKRLPL